MSKSGVEWTQYSWSPMSGCDPISPGCARSINYGGIDVMAGNKPPRPTLRIKPQECLAAPTSAFDHRIGLIRPAPLNTASPVSKPVLRAARRDFKILVSVVSLDAIPVVNLFAGQQGPTEHGLGYETMLIDIPATIGRRMLGALYQDISIGRDGPPSGPIGISLAHSGKASHLLPLDGLLGIGIRSRVTPLRFTGPTNGRAMFVPHFGQVEHLPAEPLLTTRAKPVTSICMQNVLVEWYPKPRRCNLHVPHSRSRHLQPPPVLFKQIIPYLPDEDKE